MANSQLSFLIFWYCEPKNLHRNPGLHLILYIFFGIIPKTEFVEFWLGDFTKTTEKMRQHMSAHNVKYFWGGQFF